MKENLISALPFYFTVLANKNVKALHSLALWLSQLFIFTFSNYKWLFYFIPEMLLATLFDLVRFFLRIDFSQLNIFPEEFPSQELCIKYIQVVVDHMNDLNISNPDFRESFLTKLNIILQYKKFIPLIEE